MGNILTGQPEKLFNRLIMLFTLVVFVIFPLQSVGAKPANLTTLPNEVEPNPSSPNWNPPYPRIGQITFYSVGSGDEIWKNHDLVMIRYYYGSDAKRVKAKNPDVILLAANTSLTPDFEGVDDTVGKGIGVGAMVGAGSAQPATVATVNKTITVKEQKSDNFLIYYTDSFTFSRD